MPLIMGILAQAAAAPGPTPGAGAYDLLETEILTGSQASVTFSSLNSTYGADYQHLQIRLTARTDRSDNSDTPQVVINSTAGVSHYMLGNGSTVSSQYQSGYSLLGYVNGGSAPSDAFGAIVYNILDPFDTNKYTTGRSLGGVVAGDNRLLLTSTLYQSTTAVDSIQLDPIGNFVTGCRFSLYGLRKAA